MDLREQLASGVAALRGLAAAREARVAVKRVVKSILMILFLCFKYL